MKIASWNLNSVRARRERLLRWLREKQPDVLCLQELKGTDEVFPHDEVRAEGYQTALCAQKTYNGVAILSRVGLDRVERGLGDGVDDAQARLVAADAGGVRILSVYVPNGASVGSDSWAYKLAWLERLRAHLERGCDPAQPLALCGDWNVAPEDRDVANPEQWKDGVLCHPDARRALQRILEWGLVDAFRRVNPDRVAFTWWDYQRLAFPKGDGLRIDHILASQPLAQLLRAVEIDRDERKGKLPSDHAPIFAVTEP